MLTLGSLFNGISGWILAGQKYGVETLWESEVDKFCEAVTKHHFPDVVQLGDITKLDGAKLWPVDIICAGSPCQDLSVAGKQEGLKGERSGLFRDAIRLVRAMRRASGGQAPRFFVWENVPGAFSSNHGLDFRAVLEEIGEAEIPLPEHGRWASAGMADLPRCQIAWRTLDAQYWGVPQRRKRIFLVADFTGRSAGEILFECESVRGDSSESGEAREGIAAGTESGANSASGIVAAGFKAGAGDGAGNIGYEIEKAATLMATESGTQRPTVAVYDMTHADEVMRRVPDGRAPTLNARMGTGGNQVPVVSYAIAWNIIGRENQNGGHHMGVDKDVSYTLNTVDRHAVCVGNGQLHQGISDKVGALNCMHDQQAVMIQKSVRRLTPTEAERLQGLPDGYTLIDDKTCSDTARYKALGNGMAQPCADYVIKRIVEVTT